MKTLNIDIETYSDEDLTKVGVYRYCDSPNFKILLFAYSIDGGAVKCLDLTKQELPQDLRGAIQDPSVLKIAFNAQFERVCLSDYLGEKLDPDQWQCTKIQAAELGLPASLGQCAKYLGIDEQKDTRGKRLINYFSKPNKKGERNQPEDAPEDWQTFIDYCVQDVVTEMAIADALAPFPVKESEWQLYSLDQRMNDLGVKVDQELADGAIAIMERINDRNMTQLKEVTGLDNPNSQKQLKEWLGAKGVIVDSLLKANVQTLAKDENTPEDVREALKLRLKLSNSSTKKYLTIERATTTDGRIHGILQFYGANRTGRWAGRLLQVQNLPRNYLKELDEARYFVRHEDEEALEIIFGDVPDVIKQLIRTSLIPKDGYTFYISDFSAIEARVIAWFAGEKWVLDTFRTHGKIYEATAAQMFNLGPVESYNWKDTAGKAMRQRGKVATLALGYQGGTGALEAMGALKMGIPEEDLQGLVTAWRKANPKIVRFWRNIENAAKKSLRTGGTVRAQQGLEFSTQNGFLFIKLPSGRKLAYAKARLEDGAYGEKIVYEGQGDKVAFSKLDTYGGKLVENIVQATARDVLGEAMLRIEKAGLDIVFHVHDEVIIEAPTGSTNIPDLNKLLTQAPEWAPDLPLNAEGFEASYYQKD